MAKLIITSELKSINQIEAFIAQIKNRYIVDNHKIMDIKLSILEAVNNAIIHGNQLDSSKNVLITEERNGNELIIRIEDQGKGFDPSKVQDPTCKDDLSLPGGRGIHLMRHLTDQIDYSDNGQSVILRFNL